MTEPSGSLDAPLVVYSASWCGHCRRLMRELDEAGIAYGVVDVDADRSHDARIVAATGGYRTVPAVEVGNELLVNPTIREVAAALGR